MEDDREDQIQRALNEAKKRELEEKYGAHFSPGESEASPELLSQFLHNVEEFELKYQNAGRITVRQFVGNPAFKRREHISADQLEAELNAVLDYLAMHNVEIDFLEDVPREERYRFITEELLDKETDDIRIEGMQHHFVYEEYYPNDRHDATTFAEDFLHFLLDGEVQFAMNAFCKDELLDAAGGHIVQSVMEEAVRGFVARVMTFISKSVEAVDCTVEGDYASTTFRISWDGLMAESLKRETFSGIATVRMKRSPYEGWDVVQAIVPGWNI